MEDEQRTGSEWKVIEIESETVIARTPWNQDANIDRSTSGTLTIHITVQRQSQPQNVILVGPLIGMLYYNLPLLGFLNTLVK
jgi:hypothetical protein